MNYIVSFDILRFIAVLLVLVWHWIPETNFINYPINGRIGVVLFFVLSGYLISSGLAADSIKKTKIKTLLSFYLKRFLRIFPIYYLLLLILLIINYESFREKQFWYWFYASNIYEELGNKHVAYLVHTWTLAIEEQFYLIWPVIFLLAGSAKRNILIYAVSIISIGFYIYSSVSPLKLFCYISSFKFFFCFSLGALLAFDANFFSFFQRKSIGLMVIVLTVWVLRIFHGGNIPYGLQLFALDFSFTLLALVVISNCIKYDHIVQKKATLLSPFIFIGKISYGVYLYHYLMYPFYHFLHMFSIKYNIRVPIINSILFPEFQNPFIRFFVFFVLAVMVSMVSYRFIEKPLLRLKKRI